MCELRLKTRPVEDVQTSLFGDSGERGGAGFPLPDAARTGSARCARRLPTTSPSATLEKPKLSKSRGDREPFGEQERILATGWARDGAVQEQIDASVDDAIQSARRKLPSGESLRRCENCDAEILKARREALPGVRRCLSCQTLLDKTEAGRAVGYNRRGNKDSQLR
jgi:phage/conjugal plasmid C-4 type zinc finger TraR family protein